MFSRAIVRPPCARFANGITTAGLGPPQLPVAREQHQRYCDALQRCGLAVTALAPDDRFPDSTFVEDAALVMERLAILARPGAESRRGEVESVALALRAFRPDPMAIGAPATLDAGDVCQVGEQFFIGISERTNVAGAGQLAALLAAHGYRSAPVDIRGIPRLLHLKSGLSWLGGRRLLLVEGLEAHPAFGAFDTHVVDRAEEYAANCVMINDHLLFPASFPSTEERLRTLGLDLLVLDVSEYRKMDGGLSCLSLRF